MYPSMYPSHASIAHLPIHPIPSHHTHMHSSWSHVRPGSLGGNRGVCDSQVGVVVRFGSAGQGASEYRWHVFPGKPFVALALGRSARVPRAHLHADGLTVCLVASTTTHHQSVPNWVGAILLILKRRASRSARTGGGDCQ
jgi:hypothetical protein